MENKKLNIILLIVSVIFLLLTYYVRIVIKENQDAKVLFNINDIKNIEYKNNNNSFYTNGNKFTFVVNGDTIYDENFKLNKETGEIIKDKLYIRTIQDKFILIWYNEVEYQLYK